MTVFLIPVSLGQDVGPANTRGAKMARKHSHRVRVQKFYPETPNKSTQGPPPVDSIPEEAVCRDVDNTFPVQATCVTMLSDLQTCQVNNKQ